MLKPVSTTVFDLFLITKLI